LSPFLILFYKQEGFTIERDNKDAFLCGAGEVEKISVSCDNGKIDFRPGHIVPEGAESVPDLGLRG